MPDLTENECKRIVAGFRDALNGIEPWRWRREEAIGVTARVLDLPENTVRQVLREEAE